jgi:hypothetical protein
MRAPVTSTVFLIGILLLTTNLYAQSAIVMGRISRHNMPLVNVIVSIDGKYSVTDAQGRYLIKDVPSGQSTLRIRNSGPGGTVITVESININQPRLVRDVVIP